MSGLFVDDSLMGDEPVAGQTFERITRKPKAKSHYDGKRRNKRRDQGRKNARKRKYARQGRS